MAKFVVPDVFGQTVVGTFSAWDHVLQGHAEMANYEELVKQAISSPKSVHETRDPARRLFRGATITTGLWNGSFVKVVVRYTRKNGVGFLLTAYFDTLESRDKQIWP
jgi:hypothetical protein